jgi:hypothetical protein
MEAIVMFVVLVLGFVAIDLGSILWGQDSRDQLPDTHARRI